MNTTITKTQQVKAHGDKEQIQVYHEYYTFSYSRKTTDQTVLQTSTT